MTNVEKAKKILKERLKAKEIGPRTKFSDYGLDSLDLVEIMIRIEDEIGFEFTSEEIASISTVNDVLKIVENKSK